MIYLSGAQYTVVNKFARGSFRKYANMLPLWIPAKEVGEMLGLDTSAVDRAQAYLNNRPYMWATEFENVHSTWNFEEPQIQAPNGVTYPSSEEYYHCVKANESPHNYHHVMFGALWLKFVHSKKSVELLTLLINTWPHPLLSIKEDEIWGFHPRKGGKNLLAKMLQNIRKIVISKIREDALYTAYTVRNIPAHSDAKQRIQILYSCYETKFKPPAWALQMYDDPVFCQNQKNVVVYTLSALDENFYTVSNKRVPTNICDYNYYTGQGETDNKNLLFANYGHSKSGYHEVFEKYNRQQLGPNIALWCETRFRPADYDKTTSLIMSLLDRFRKCLTISVLNVVGFSFDSISQPDYIYYVKNDNMSLFGNDLVDVFRLMFRAWACHKAKNDTMILSEFGSGAFSTNFPHGKASYIQDFFYVALWTAWKELNPMQRPKNMGMMGGKSASFKKRLCETDPYITQQMVDDECHHDHSRILWLNKACPEAGVFVCGLFPDIVFDKIYQPDPQNEPLWWKIVETDIQIHSQIISLSESMFVNAWDPHSIVGNGNAGDQSLDGYMGRCTEMAALSFSGTNTAITYKQL
jgi:predicted NAD-dependent protein-ADP-ribosyltransferase YbiA (DUF1768 family)